MMFPINNHVETEDAYSYALQTQTADSYAELLHPHHRLYHPLMKWLNDFFQIEDTFTFLVRVSSFFSLLAMCFFYPVLFKLTGSVRKSLILLGLLSVSYGYWRYTKSVEVIPMGWFVMSVGYFLVLRGSVSRTWVMVTLNILITLICVNVHVALLVPVGALNGIVLLGQRRWLHLASYVCGFGAAFIATQMFFSSVSVSLSVENRASSGEVPEAIKEGEKDAEAQNVGNVRGLKLSSAPKAIVGLGSSLVGVYPIMQIDPVYEVLENRLFENRFLREERLLGAQLTGWQIGVWLLGVVVLFIFILYQCWRVVLFLKSRNKQLRSVNSLEHHAVEYAICIAALASCALIVWFEPGNPEMWTIFLPAIILPCLLFIKVYSCRILIVIFVVLMATNYLGGISLLRDKSGDYYAATSDTFIEASKAGDILLLGTTNSGVRRYCNYYSEMELIGSALEDEWNEVLDLAYAKLVLGKKVGVHQTLAEKKGFRDLLGGKGIRFVKTERSLGGGYLILER
jgi:hypothetical protein